MSTPPPGQQPRPESTGAGPTGGRPGAQGRPDVARPVAPDGGDPVARWAAAGSPPPDPAAPSYPTPSYPAPPYPTASYPTVPFPTAPRYPAVSPSPPVRHPTAPYPGAPPYPTAPPIPDPRYPAARRSPTAPPPGPVAPSAPRPRCVLPRALSRALRIVLDVLLLIVCLFFAIGTAGVQSDGINGWWVLLFMVGATAASVTILFRRRHPALATVIAACLTLVQPLDNLAVLICLPWVIARCPARTAWRVGVLASVAAVVALVRDAVLGPERSIFFIADEVTGERLPWPAVGYAAIGVFLLVVSIGVGLLRRSRGTVARAESAQRRLRAELTTELSRQDERDLIARELHDTVAHHLSVVSLRASALEVSGDDAVQEAAQSVRTSTHQALEEMRDLIGVLRTGQASLTAGPGPGRTLSELPELIATARESGADVAANVFVTGGESAPTPLTRAVYRIVQESLTNAIKHAPQHRIDLDLRASPGIGVHLRVTNPLPSGPVDAPGSGTGLLGVRERVASVGGTVEAGLQGDRWVLTAHLPWPTAD